MKTKRNVIQIWLLCAAMLEGIHQAAAQQQVPDACWSGTWKGIYSFETDTCGHIDSGIVMLTLVVSNGVVVSASASEDGILCYNPNGCKTNGTSIWRGALTGTITGNEITLSGIWTNNCSSNTNSTGLGGTLSGCTITGWPSLTLTNQTSCENCSNCSFMLVPGSTNLSAAGGSASVQVTTGDKGANCPWTAWRSANWITINSGMSGTGNGTVYYYVEANTNNSPRNGALFVADTSPCTGTVLVADQEFIVSQDGAGNSGCTYLVIPNSASYGPGAGTGTLSVITASNDCPWTAVANTNWLTIVAGSNSTGTATVTYSFAANTNADWRSGTLTITDQTVTVSQAGVSNCVWLVTTASSPSAGVVTSGGGMVGCGSNVTVIATPNTNYSFLDWTEGGTNVSTSMHYTFEAHANRDLVANFTNGPAPPINLSIRHDP
jgi:hypothetical protein